MKWKPLLLSHLAILILVGSFIWPATRSVWDTIDVAIFKFLNGTLAIHPGVQLFWAFVNHKRADLVEDAIFLLFFIIAILKTPQKRHRTAQFIFSILLVSCSIYCVNRCLFRYYSIFPRESPSLIVTPCIRLSEEIPWLSIKDETSASFPGDHATTLLFFATLYTHFAGPRLGTLAWLYAIFRLLPRLILGAHWLSDIAVGTVAIVLFVLSWTLSTPFHIWIIDKIEQLMKLFPKRPYGIKKDPL